MTGRRKRSVSVEKVATRDGDKRKKSRSGTGDDGDALADSGASTSAAGASSHARRNSRSEAHVSPPATQAKPDIDRTAKAKSSEGTPLVVAGKNKLTRMIFDQIPFLESDPLKALEVLKKMVQESGLETLYTSVNDNTSRARDFSDRISELKKQVDVLVKSMLSGKLSEEEKLDKYKEMKGIWAKVHGLNEAKVKLTQEAYDMVDRVIRRLDKELESIVSEIGMGKTSSGEKGPRAKGGQSEGPNRARMRGADFDMPVDPNEPTYCECKQISFGEMIACDNQNCPIEWFHFACVGLTSKPKGKWFCKRCVAAGQNKLGKKKKSRLGIIEKYASASDKSEVEHMMTATDSD